MQLPFQKNFFLKGVGRRLGGSGLRATAVMKGKQSNEESTTKHPYCTEATLHSGSDVAFHTKHSSIPECVALHLAD